MAKRVDNKFVWVIKNFSSLNEHCYSTPVQIGDCKWHLCVTPKTTYNVDHLSLFLQVSDPESMPIGWRRYIKFRLAIVRQVSEKPSVVKEAHRWFDQEQLHWGFQSMISFTRIHDKSEGFLENDELEIVAEVDVLQVVGTLMKPDETNLSKLKVESVSSSQDITVEFRARNQHLKTACMNLLLSLTQALCQTPLELSIDDLVEAEKALAYMKVSGLEVDWLEKKLNEVKETKK